jgi:hypothetical protein
MVFTLDEIKKYLQSQKSIDDAINNLNEQNIVCLIEDFSSLNFQKNEENLVKYEMSIGLHKIKEKQRSIYINSNRTKGKYWMALSPKWISNNEIKKKLNTEFEIRYWVNYGDNDVYGWFTVEQIKQWLTTPDLKLRSLGGSW